MYQNQMTPTILQQSVQPIHQEPSIVQQLNLEVVGQKMPIHEEPVEQVHLEVVGHAMPIQGVQTEDQTLFVNEKTVSSSTWYEQAQDHPDHKTLDEMLECEYLKEIDRKYGIGKYAQKQPEEQQPVQHTEHLELPNEQSADQLQLEVVGHKMRIHDGEQTVEQSVGVDEQVHLEIVGHKMPIHGEQSQQGAVDSSLMSYQTVKDHPDHQTLDEFLECEYFQEIDRKYGIGKYAVHQSEKQQPAEQSKQMIKNVDDHLDEIDQELPVKQYVKEHIINKLVESIFQ